MPHPICGRAHINDGASLAQANVQNTCSSGRMSWTHAHANVAAVILVAMAMPDPGVYDPALLYAAARPLLRGGRHAGRGGSTPGHQPRDGQPVAVGGQASGHRPDRGRPPGIGICPPTTWDVASPTCSDSTPVFLSPSLPPSSGRSAVDVMGGRWPLPSPARSPPPGSDRATCCWCPPDARSTRCPDSSSRPCPVCWWPRPSAATISPRSGTRPTRSRVGSPTASAARATYLFAPALPGPNLHPSLLQDPSIQRVLDLWPQARCALMGIGAPPLSRSDIPRFVPTDSTSLRRAVGDVCSRFYDRDGAPSASPASTG